MDDRTYEERVGWAYEQWSEGMSITEAAFMYGVTEEEIFDEFASRDPEGARSVRTKVTTALVSATVLGPLLLLWDDARALARRWL